MGFLTSAPFACNSNPNIEIDCEVLEGLYKCIDGLSENDAFVYHIHNELLMYKKGGYIFGILAAIRKRTTMAFGNSSACKHKLEYFEHKRSRFEWQKL
ncbi:hypothetical protein CR513_29549, partial [Mucuna pruriens]